MIKPEIKQAVKTLYVEKGYKPSEIARLTGIDCSTIYDWINAGTWKEERTNKIFKLTKEQLAAIPAKPLTLSQQTHVIKEKAAALIKAGYTQKSVAHQVGISEKTMSKWSRKHKWKGKAL